MKKKHKVVLGLALSASLVFLGVKLLQNPANDDIISDPDTWLKDKTVMKSNQEIKTYKDVAILTLERSDEQLGAEELDLVTQALVKAYDYVQSVGASWEAEPSKENGLFLTSTGMVQSMVFLHGLDYHFDSSTVEVYPSEADNVYQFVYQVTSEGADPINYSGNYAINSKQLEIVHQIGTIDKIKDDHDDHDHEH